MTTGRGYIITIETKKNTNMMDLILDSITFGCKLVLKRAFKITVIDTESKRETFFHRPS